MIAFFVCFISDFFPNENKKLEMKYEMSLNVLLLKDKLKHGVSVTGRTRVCLQIK